MHGQAIDEQNPYRYEPTIAAEAPADARSAFITKTYMHLLGAIAAFVGLEVALFKFVDIDALMVSLYGSRWGMLMIFGAFIGVSWIADSWARSATSKLMQYAGLGLYVVAEAVIFLPLLYMAVRYGGEDVIPSAALLTGVMFGGLTAVVFLTRKDFSFMRGALILGSFAAFGFIIAAMVLGFNTGIFFSGAMVVLASGFILYSTSNVLHHYRIGQHVAASLALFAAVAMLFFYILRIFMSRD
jgi:FtsH-binding integral membrane protein